MPTMSVLIDLKCLWKKDLIMNISSVQRAKQKLCKLHVDLKLNVTQSFQMAVKIMLSEALVMLTMLCDTSLVIKHICYMKTSPWKTSEDFPSLGK